MIAEFCRAPLTRWIVGWHIIWGVPAIFIAAPRLILILNCLVFAIAVGVVAAYFKDVMVACRKRVPSKGDILVVGIWIAWISLIEARLWSIGWRVLGRPDWLVDIDITTHIIAMALLAGVMHLAGPESIEGHIPSRQWIRIGLMAAAGALAAIVLLLYFGETGSLLHRR